MCTDGSVYEGFLSENRQCSCNIQSYDGKYTDGLKNGYGKCVYKDGSEYEGEWLKGVRNGYGIFTFPNSKVKYEGEWYNDKLVSEFK